MSNTKSILLLLLLITFSGGATLIVSQKEASSLKTPSNENTFFATKSFLKKIATTSFQENMPRLLSQFTQGRQQDTVEGTMGSGTTFADISHASFLPLPLFWKPQSFTTLKNGDLIIWDRKVLRIVAGAVTSKKIADHTIEDEDIARNAITSRAIDDGTIIGDDVSQNADLIIQSLTTTGDLTIGGTTSFAGNLDMQNNLIQNIGNAGTDFTSTGGLTLAGSLSVSGTINGLTVTNNGTNTLNIAGGKTLTVSDSATIATNSITLAGGEIVTFSATNALSILTTGGTSVTLPTTGTLYGTATDSITSLQLLTSLSDETGTGVAVFGTSPTFTTQITTPSIITASGALDITPFAGSNLNVTLSGTGDFAVNTNQLYVDTSTGNVGVGTTSPFGKLTVLGGTDTITSSVGSGPRLQLGDTNAANSYAEFGAYAGINNLDSKTRDLKLFNAGGSIYLQNSTGNVGIGTTTPGALLQVGTMRVWQGGLGTSVATGQDSTFIGRLAGNANNTPSAANGIYNTFVGSTAGALNTSGYATTDLGYGAGASNTIGNVNTNIGYQSGFGNVSGNYNTNIGADAGSSNTVDNNIFIGYHAGMNPTPILTGVQNIFIGNEVAEVASSAHDNTGLGYRSGYGITTGYENVFNGSLAGFAVTDGYQNVVIGKEAGKTFTTGYNNVLVGYRAGYSMQTGGYFNTGVGNLSLFGVTTGAQNTAFGANSGQKVTTGGLNTFIGNAAGNGVGQKVDASNSMALGNGANTTADNQVVIGNTSVTQTLLNGNVGIGTTGPGGKLDVRDGNFVLSDADVAHGMTALAPTEVFGKFLPENATGGGLGIYGISDTDLTGLALYGIMGSTNPTDTVPAITLIGEKKNTTGGQALAAAETVLKIQNYSTDLVTVLGNGNVGIGTTTPRGELHISNTGGARLMLEDSDYTTGQRIWDMRSYNGDFQVARSTDVGSLYDPSLVIQQSGNVGIGTTGPVVKLDVSGSSAANVFARVTNTNTAGEAGIVLGEVVSGSTPFYIQRFGSTDATRANDVEFVGTGDFVFSPTGNVGIGTTGPAYKLNVAGVNVGGGYTTMARFEDGGNTNDSGARLELTYAGGARGGFIQGGRDATGNQGMAFGTQLNGSYSTAMSILSTGNVGIGTTNPGYKTTIFRTTSGVPLELHVDSGSTGDVNGIDFTHYSVPASVAPLRAYVRDYINSDWSTDLNFGVAPAVALTGASTAVTIKGITGNVGIGTTNPGTKLEIGSSDLGNGVAGPVITLGRNTNATATGAGSLNFMSRAGTAGYVWQDAAGMMRINTAAPTNANDTAGTVVGTQASSLSSKNLIAPFSNYTVALQAIIDAPLYDFTYKSGAYNDQAFTGIITDYSPVFGMDKDPSHPNGKSLNMITAIGYTFGAIKQLNQNFENQNTANSIILTDLNLKTTANITTLTGLQNSVDSQLLIASNKIDVLTVSDTAQKASVLALESAQTTQAGEIVTLKNSLALQVSLTTTMQAELATIMEFYNTLSLGSIVIKDASGNVDLLGGNLQAGKITSINGFVIDTSHSTAPTIGTATLYPVAVDGDSDGKDDFSGLSMTDPDVMARDGKSIVIPTSAVQLSSRIFVTPIKSDPQIIKKEIEQTNGNFITIETPIMWSVVDQKNGESFTIKTSDPVAKEMKFNWLIMEEK